MALNEVAATLSSSSIRTVTVFDWIEMLAAPLSYVAVAVLAICVPETTPVACAAVAPKEAERRSEAAVSRTDALFMQRPLPANG